MTTKTATQKAEVDEARRELLEHWGLKRGETVYTILRHVSQSGMHRIISPIIIRENRPVDITSLVAKLLGHESTRCEAGKDMGFVLVYDLSVMLFCPEKYDHDAAYALQQKWL